MLTAGVLLGYVYLRSNAQGNIHASWLTTCVELHLFTATMKVKILPLLPASVFTVNESTR